MRMPDIYDQMIINLLILAIASAYQNGLSAAAPQLILAVATAALLDFAIRSIKLKRYVLPKSGIITGLFVGSILDFSTPWYAAIVAAGIAIALKHVIVYKRKNVFNPAALGLVVSGMLFGFGGVWWSATNPLLIIVLGALIAYRVKGQYMLVPFLILFFLLFSASKGFNVSAGTFLNPLILFFAFFMLTEHKTAPHQPVQRAIYGSVIAVLALAFFYYLPAHFLLAALLLGNVCGIAIERLVKR